jgi:hypothetical protein
VLVWCVVRCGEACVVIAWRSVMFFLMCDGMLWRVLWRGVWCGVLPPLPVRVGVCVRACSSVCVCVNERE